MENQKKRTKMKKYRITVERPAWILETWTIETDDKINFDWLPKKWMDDNAEQLGTEVLRNMDDEEIKAHGFGLYLNDVEEVKT